MHCLYPFWQDSRVNPALGGKAKKNKKRKSKANGTDVNTDGEATAHDRAAPDEGEEDDSRSLSEPPSTPLTLHHDDQKSTSNGLPSKAQLEGEGMEGKDQSQSLSHVSLNASPQEGSTQVTTNASHRDADTQKAPEDNGDSLRSEISRLQESLELAQSTHESQLKDIRGQLALKEQQKDHAESQYQGLLGKVNTIRSQLGERLKADAVST